MTVRLILLLILAMPLSACVSQGTHKEALAQIQNLQGERDGLSNKVKELESSLDKKEKELQVLSENLKVSERGKNDAAVRIKEIEGEVETKSKEVAKLKTDVEDVRVAKDKEIEDIKFKIKEVQARAEALLEKIKEIQQ